MDNMIEAYISLTFHEELQTQIYKSFRLFGEFNYPDYQLDYMNILMSEDTMLAEDMQDKFLQTVRKQLDFLIESHLITLSESANLSEVLDVLYFLYYILNMHDYNQIYSLLIATEDIYECFANAVHEVSNVDPSTVLTIITNIDPLTYKHLVTYVANKIKSKELDMPRYSEIGKEIVANMRNFITFSKKDDLLGIRLMNSDTLLNQPIKGYKSFIGDFFSALSNEDIAYNMLSLLYLNKDGIDKPLFEYKENVDLFLNDLNKISLVENILINILNDYMTFIKANDEKDRLSKASHIK